MSDLLKYIAYYRVSTQEQGNSGLGLNAQQSSVRAFAKASGELVGEYVEVESGTHNSRKELDAAIDACVALGAVLVVKNLSRISRGGYKVMGKLQDLGVTFIESTSPYDNQLIKEFKFSLAKEEREKISERTSSALQEIKKKITKGQLHISKAGNIVRSLGCPDNLSAMSRERASISIRAKAANDENNKRATSLIVALRASGLSFYAITKQLNDTGFKTSRGNNFSEMQSKRLYVRHTKLNKDEHSTLSA